jgi:hypothetical protein
VSDEQQTVPQPPDWPRDKADLIARIRQGRAALADLIAGLSEVRLTTPGSAGGWSVKDHLAHLTAWERLVIGRLRGQTDREHEVVGMDEAAYAAADEESLNAFIYQRHKDQPLGEVRAAFDAATDEVLALVDAMTWEDLRRPTFPDLPGSGALLGNVVGNTYGHFNEHQEWIQDLLNG